VQEALLDIWVKEAGLVLDIAIGFTFNLVRDCFEICDLTTGESPGWFGDVHAEFMENANGPISDFLTLFLLKICGFSD
jgi:hypothetical protein